MINNLVQTGESGCSGGAFGSVCEEMWWKSDECKSCLWRASDKQSQDKLCYVGAFLPFQAC